MTDRMTPEREAQIRQADAAYGGSITLPSRGSIRDRRDLLRELDAVRAEREEARAVLKSAGILDYDKDFIE